MGVRSRSKSKRRRRATPPPSAAAAGVDLISDLSDDLLVRVLELLPDARDAVRTHALSRRWRALWTRVAALRFVDSNRRREFREPGGLERFVAFVDHALAFRAAEKEPALEHLAISFNLSLSDDEEASSDSEQLVPPSIEAVQGWIRYAMQHAVRSLNFELILPWPSTDEDDNGGDDDNYSNGNPVMTLDDLVSSAKLETMRLKLRAVNLRLPSVAAFASLTDLSLENVEVEAGDGHLLARLVSSACCPRLHRLRLVGLGLPGMEEALLIDAGALLELSILGIDDLRFLELRTPSLRVLHVKQCYELEGLTVSAHRLEDIKFLVQHPLHIDGDLSSVARLKIELCSSHGHGYLYDHINDGSIRLLECCRLIRCLEVSLQVPKRKQQDVDIIKGSIPQLPHVASLKIHVTLRERSCSDAAAGIASLLEECRSIRYLSLNICYYRKNDPELDRLLCDNSAPIWESHELSLPHLQVAEFEKLMGTDDELQFIRFILKRASGIQKVAFSFDRKSGKKAARMVLNLCLPPLAGGSWTTWTDDANLLYNWRCCA
ncbi:hypothetical protein C2845_PM15G22100 [Panicum miliaceum]|uniref:F-box domain-containing protein n=1 Tax=Panicum miliaceum TaxID=4540 RepID=A0A3L6Q7Q9_PANMI|nr:hypothetical protein C2845_PM15G22100 [Panicum miliaceum]